MTSTSSTLEPMVERAGGAAAIDLAARALLVGLAFLLGCFQMADYDIWWHLRTGELIPSRGVPVTDWYSFTSADNAWIDVHWGFQLLMAWVHDRFGAAGIVFTKALVGAIAVAVALSAWRREWPAALQVFVWLPALFLLSSRIYERPEIFTLVYLAAFLTVLFHAEGRPGLLWLLVPVQVLWANFQGLFVFGPILLAMYFVEAVLRMDQVRGLFRRLLPVMIGVAAACFLSPYTFRNIELVLEIWRKMTPQGQVFRENIAELIDVPTLWRQGGYESPFVWLLLFLLAASAASSIVGWRAIVLERRVFRLLALGAFGWLGIQATRNGNHFALVAGTVIGWNLGPVVGRFLRGARWSAAALALVLLATWFAASGRWHLAVGGHRRFGFSERPYHYSAEGMRVAGMEGMPERAAIFHIGHAAQYIHVNGPERKVYMDGRLEVHSPRQFREYLALHDSFTPQGDWDANLRRLGVDLVVIDGEHNSPAQAAVLASPRWQCLYYDSVLGVFLRRERPLPAGAREVDFRARIFVDGPAGGDLPPPTPPPSWWFLPPNSFPPGAADFAAERAFHLGLGLWKQPAGSPVQRLAVLWYAARQAQEAIRARPWAVEPRRFLGASLLLLSAAEPGSTPYRVSEPWDPQRGLLPAIAMAQLRDAIHCDPDDFSAPFYLQQALDQAGATSESIEILERLVRRRPRNRAQIALARELPKELEARRARRAELEGAGAALLPSDLRDGAAAIAALEGAAKTGRLSGALTPAVFAAAVDWPPTAIDRVGTWLIALGRAADARNLYEHPSVAPRLPAELVERRRAEVDLLSGRFGEAGRRLDELADSSPASDAAAFQRAVLALLQGDAPALRRSSDALDSLRPGSAQWLRGLLPEKGE